MSGLLQCLDGFDRREGVVVIAATNHVAHIDAALRRPGRFDRTVRIDQPSPELMAQAFRWHLSRDLAGVDLTGIAAAATGMTGAEVAATVRDAKARARHNRVPLAQKHVMAAVQNRRPPLDPALRHLVAIHECGHAIVAQATGCARTERFLLPWGSQLHFRLNQMILKSLDQFETLLAIDDGTDRGADLSCHSAQDDGPHALSA